MSKHHLLDYTNMSKEELEACLKRVDINKFLLDPNMALKEAGATFKKGVSFKFVDSEVERNALPSNVIPLKRPILNKAPLSEQDLEKVAGGAILFDWRHNW